MNMDMDMFDKNVLLPRACRIRNILGGGPPKARVQPPLSYIKMSFLLLSFLLFSHFPPFITPSHLTGHHLREWVLS